MKVQLFYFALSNYRDVTNEKQIFKIRNSNLNQEGLDASNEVTQSLIGNHTLENKANTNVTLHYE
jgi:hypothetical protein